MTHHWPTAVLWALVIIMTIMLSGCTYTEAHYGDASLVSWRVWTDTSASVETEGMRAAYSSDADTAAAMSMNQRLLDALLGARLAAPGP